MPESPPRSADSETDLRALMAGFPSGVAIITAVDDDGRPHGLTCSSLSSVALSPPSLVICIRSASPTLDVILRGHGLAVNLLQEQAHEVSSLFASGHPERFSRVGWRLPLNARGPHLIEDAHATADCLVARSIEIGDHTAVFAEVERITLREGMEPLLYGKRRYARWSDAAAVPVPDHLPTAGAFRVRP